MTSLRAAAM
jgi:hypothetical protein